MSRWKAVMVALAFAAAYSCSIVPGAPLLGDNPPQGVSDTYKPEGDRVRVESWVEGLEAPWSLVFLPGERALVSERPGRIRLIEKGRLRAEPWATVDVHATGEAGLMGLAVHPDFPSSPYVYVMHTYKGDAGVMNRVIRMRDENGRGVMDRVIIDNIPGARFHDGGRLAFGPDRMLYVTTGENFDSSLAHDLGSLGGKILRLTADGAIPADNPFKSAVYSYGHRNPQGLAFRPAGGALYSSEHGPSGESGLFGHDEVNVIVKGGDYGWPEAVGAPGDPRYRDPIIFWKQATPPSGMTFYDAPLMPHLRGDLFIATLRSTALVRVVFDGERVKAIERWFNTKDGEDRYGRLRDIVQGPDGALYLLTNNRDGRGRPRAGDDHIYRIGARL